MPRQARTHTKICECGFCHFAAILADSHLANIVTLQPIKSSVEHTKGMKFRHCSRQASRGKPRGISASFRLVKLSLFLVPPHGKTYPQHSQWVPVMHKSTTVCSRSFASRIHQPFHWKWHFHNILRFHVPPELNVWIKS
jgi:hypothetical protein